MTKNVNHTKAFVLTARHLQKVGMSFDVIYLTFLFFLKYYLAGHTGPNRMIAS